MTDDVKYTPNWTKINDIRLKTPHLAGLLGLNPNELTADEVKIKVKDVNSEIITFNFIEGPSKLPQVLDTRIFPALVVISDQHREEIQHVYGDIFSKAQKALDLLIGGMFSFVFPVKWHIESQKYHLCNSTLFILYIENNDNEPQHSQEDQKTTKIPH